MRILIDGYNLSLTKGTGIATYARSLSRNLHQMGHEVDVLYGAENAQDRTDLMREIAFFDIPKDKHRNKYIHNSSFGVQTK